MSDYRTDARHFVRHETPFHLGFLPTEQSNPKTADLARIFERSSVDGVRNLQSVDRDVLAMAEKVLRSPEWMALTDAGEAAIRRGGRIVFSGCGATGRLSILLEAMWKRCCRTHGAPQWADSVQSIMTGGDFAMVKSVESFEDYAVYGARQVRDLKMDADDLLVAITEGGETSSVLGTLAEFTRLGGKGFLLFNNPASLLAEHLERSRLAITDPAVTVLDLYCGPMALAGSTRMQATTSEQLIASSALEVIFRRLTGEEDAVDFASGFAALLDQLEAPAAVEGMAAYLDFECDIYRKKGHITYFADDFMLDIFTDTTERSPTFMLPPFRRMDDAVSPLPWAFARNPLYATPEAIRRAFGRELRCLEWTKEDYLAMSGAESAAYCNPPSIGAADLCQFPLGNEPLPERMAHPEDTAVHFFCGAVQPEIRSAFDRAAAGFPRRKVLHLGSDCGEGDFAVPFIAASTRMRIWEHLGVKLTLNTISTGTMVKFGRVKGNWMSYVAISNKKLIDRAIRLISHIGGIPYETAAEELFRSREELAELPPSAEKPPAVIYTLKRLGLDS